MAVAKMIETTTHSARSVLTRIGGALTICLGLCAPAGLSAAPISNIYVFGDSLVDAGNTQALLLGAGLPDPTPASSGYFQGHFTNGPDYVDILNMQLFGTPTAGFVTAPLTGNNFAFGGARARNNGDLIPDLSQQVGAFLGRSGGIADPNALYVVNAGGNDLFDFVSGGFGDPTTMGAQAAFAAQVFGTFQTALTQLSDAGAQSILVTGLPDVSRSVRIQLTLANPSDPTIDAQVAGARGAAVAFDDLFSQFLDSLDTQVSAQFLRFDYIDFFDQILSDLPSFGLPADLNLVTPCVVALPGQSTPDCTPYAFFDAVHPEARLQALIAAQVGNTLVPEPSTYALAALGMGMLIARRRRSRAAPVRSIP